MSGGRSGSTPTPPQVSTEQSFLADIHCVHKKADHDIAQQTALSGTESPTVGQANGESVPAGAAATVVRPGKLVVGLFFCSGHRSQI